MELLGTRRGYAPAALDAFAVKLGINGSTLEDTDIPAIDMSDLRNLPRLRKSPTRDGGAD
jgi:hypothetical protein